jgi:hypothetical protein
MSPKAPNGVRVSVVVEHPDESDHTRRLSFGEIGNRPRRTEDASRERAFVFEGNKNWRLAHCLVDETPLLTRPRTAAKNWNAVSAPAIHIRRRNRTRSMACAGHSGYTSMQHCFCQIRLRGTLATTARANRRENVIEIPERKTVESACSGMIFAVIVAPFLHLSLCSAAFLLYARRLFASDDL